MLSALLLSFAVIFVAELGDKSQLMAMTFALRYKWYVVIGGITVATTVVHLVSVAVGHFLGVSIPTEAISIVGGLAFVVFGLWTLRGDSLSDDEGAKASRVTKSAFLAIASAFFLAELGDKTMLATVTLAADNDWPSTCPPYSWRKPRSWLRPRNRFSSICSRLSSATRSSRT